MNYKKINGLDVVLEDIDKVRFQNVRYEDIYENLSEMNPEFDIEIESIKPSGLVIYWMDYSRRAASINRLGYEAVKSPEGRYVFKNSKPIKR